MTLEEIKKGAPDGATHYHEYTYPVFINIEYARFINGVREIWNHHCNEWMCDILDEHEQPNEEFKPL